MSDFVQRSQRSVRLPLGCRDLTDVDETRNWEPVRHRDWPHPTSDRLAYVEGYLDRMIQKAGKSKLVGVSRHQDHGQVMVIPDLDLSRPVLFASWRNSAQEQAVRDVLEEAGVSLLTGLLGRWKSKRSLKYALRGDSAAAARLIGEVLRAGYGLHDLSEIRVLYHESRPSRK